VTLILQRFFLEEVLSMSVHKLSGIPQTTSITVIHEPFPHLNDI